MKKFAELFRAHRKAMCCDRILYAYTHPSQHLYLSYLHKVASAEAVGDGNLAAV